MNILFLADNFPPERNAQASRVYERACYWVRWGHAATIVTCCPNYPEGKVFLGYKNTWRSIGDADGIRVVRVKTFIAPNAGTVLRILDFISYMFTAFLAGLFERRPDLIVVTSPQFFAAIAACVLATVRRLPFVLELSDLWPDSIVAVGAMKKNFALGWLERVELLLYRRAIRIVALTSAFKDNLVRRGVTPGKIDVVVNGVDLGRYQPRSRDHQFAEECGIQPDDFVVGYVGTIGMAHALENVLNSAALVPDHRIKFLLVGPGAERDRLAAAAASRGLHNVLFPPAQPKDRMPAVWSICNIALVHLKNTPLFATVIPSKIFEAMGMGLPVLLSVPEGEASKIVRREEVGICVPPEDPAALSAAVMFLSENPAYQAQLAARSQAAAPRFSRERQAREMLTSFEIALGPQDTVTPAGIGVNQVPKKH